MRREGVQNAGNMQRNARPHQHIAHAGQHRAVDRGKVRHLHLLEEVDAHGILVAFPRQKHLDKIAHNAQLDHFAQIAALVHGRHRIRLPLRLAAGDEILLPDALGHFRERKCIQPPAHVTALVAFGKASQEK